MRFAFREERPRTNPTEDALTVECKPVGKSHRVKAHYGEKGIKRFVVGDYAWAMQDTMMIGYVKDGFTVDSELLTYLSSPEATCLNTTELPVGISPTSTEPPIYRTIHGRDFPWRDGRGKASDIRIYHSWHNL